MAIRAISTSGYDCNVGEGSIMIVAEEHAGLRVDGYIDVRPAIIIKVIGDRSDRIARPRLQDACLLADIRESSISVVVIKNVSIAGKAAGAAHHWYAFPLAICRLTRSSGFRWIEFDVITDEQIKMTIPVVIEPGAAGAPADLFLV